MLVIRFWGEVTLPGETKEAGSPCDNLVRWRGDTQRFHRQAFQEGSPIRLSYHPDTDSLYIAFHPGPSAHTVEIVDGFNVDFDTTGGIVGFDIDHASRHLDVSTLEAEAPGILQRVSDRGHPEAVHVETGKDFLRVFLSDGRGIAVPLFWYPRLCEGTVEELNNWELHDGRKSISWPGLDELIGVSDLLEGTPSGAYPSSLESQKETPSSDESYAQAVDVETGKDFLRVFLGDGRVIAVSLSWYPRLCHGTAEEAKKWNIPGEGRSISWPGLDEDIGVCDLLDGFPSGESARSYGRWLQARKQNRGLIGEEIRIHESSAEFRKGTFHD